MELTGNFLLSGHTGATNRVSKDSLTSRSRQNKMMTGHADEKKKLNFYKSTNRIIDEF